MGKKSDRSKAGVIAGLLETRRQILESAASFSLEQEEQAFIGEWGIKDLLAHLAGWDYTNLDGVKALLAGQVPGFFAQRDRDWKTYNAMLVARHRCDDLSDMISAVREAQGKLIAFLDTLTDEDFGRVVRVNTFRMSIARLLNFEIMDEKAHLEQIQVFLAGQLEGDEKNITG